MPELLQKMKDYQLDMEQQVKDKAEMLRADDDIDAYLEKMGKKYAKRRHPTQDPEQPAPPHPEHLDEQDADDQGSAHPGEKWKSTFPEAASRPG
ncbi:hypothetical protein E4U17_003284 [Claviceps sp. LM77 group G4]|nr:hypothetical protein E4U17_003284 [Claviceps sp. LM77 group G4]